MGGCMYDNKTPWILRLVIIAVLVILPITGLQLNATSTKYDTSNLVARQYRGYYYRSNYNYYPYYNYGYYNYGYPNYYNYYNQDYYPYYDSYYYNPNYYYYYPNSGVRRNFRYR